MLPTFLFFLRISSAICGLLCSQMNFRTIAPTAEGGQDHLPPQWPPLPTWNFSPAVGWGGVGAAWLGGIWHCFPGPPASLYPCKSSSHLSLLCSLKSSPKQSTCPAMELGMQVVFLFHSFQRWLTPWLQAQMPLSEFLQWGISPRDAGFLSYLTARCVCLSLSKRFISVWFDRVWCMN